MSALPLPRAGHPHPGPRTLLGFAALTALACVLVAALLTLAVPSTGGFGRNLLISECIGLAILAWVMLLRRLPAVRRLGHTSAIVVVTLVGMPLGYLSGYSLAYALLDEPLQQAVMGPGRIVAVVTTLLATGFVGYILWMRSRIAVEAAARSEAQRLAAESQLRLLRAQLEPHMLFNTLANLRSLVEEDPKLAQTMIDQLNTYLRAALAASRTESTPLRQEFAQLQAYLEIMALRMGARLSFGLDLPDALQPVAIPPMLLQPLVENAIRHGLEPKIGGGRIDVIARRDGRFIEIVVADTGLGLADERGPAAGYGLQHVRDRLAAVYGPEASLTWGRSTPQGVRATVRIPA
jgi:signal transduction histidine kinase